MWQSRDVPRGSYLENMCRDFALAARIVFHMDASACKGISNRGPARDMEQRLALLGLRSESDRTSAVDER